MRRRLLIRLMWGQCWNCIHRLHKENCKCCGPPAFPARETIGDVFDAEEFEE